MTFSKRHTTDLLSGPLVSGIFLYTIPIIFTNVLQLLFNAADLVIVGQFCGSVSVAAVGATSNLTSLLVNFFVGLSVGTGVAVAHGIGGHQDEEVRRTVHTTIPLALVSGIVLTVVGMTWSGRFLEMMDTPQSVLPLSTVYMRICFAGVTFTMLYNFCAAILRAAGDTKSPLIFLVLAGILNVIMNLVFVRIFRMNVAGVALATVLSQGVSAVLVVAALMRRTDACKLVLREMRFYGAQIQKILRVGLPAGIQSTFFNISNVLIQAAVNSFGEVFVSASAASGNIENFLYLIVNSFHQTAVNYIGQNAGAGQYSRVKKIIWIVFASVTAVSLAMAGICYFFGRELLSIYIPNEPEVIAYGYERLVLVSLPYFLCGLMDVSTGMLRGLGSAVIPMVFCLLGACGFRIVWIRTVFQQYHTIPCLLSSYPLSWALTALCQLIALVFVYRKHLRRMQMYSH